MVTNWSFRDYVTRIGFQVTLSHTQIDYLVCVAENISVSRVPEQIHFIATGRALHRRGLVTEHMVIGNRNGTVLTRAGELVVELLKESGIYAEVLARFRGVA
jgi:hypothetical protein